MTTTSLRCCLFSASLIALLMLPCQASAVPVQIGFGVGTPQGNLDGGTPTNLDRNAPQVLAAENYNVLQFDVRILNSGGGRSAIPFLATGAPSNYTVIWVGPNFVPGVNGVHNVSYTLGTQTFSLLSSQTIFAGVDTDLGPLVDFANGGTTDHHGSPGFGTIFVGQNLTGFTNPGIGRTYLFDLIVDVVPVPEPSTLTLLGLGCVGLVAQRRRKMRAGKLN